jgi:adenosine deaminase
MSSAPPVDLPFARSLPKIEVRGRQPLLSELPSSVHGHQYTICSANLSKLHAHLTGSISRACLHDIWEARRQQEPQLELEDPLVAIPPGKVDYDVQTYGLVFSLFHLIASAPSDMP